jgi:hypothetical protein
MAKASNANPIIAKDGPQGVLAPVAWHTPQVAAKLAEYEMSVPTGNVHLATTLRVFNAATAKTIVKKPKANQPPPASFMRAKINV